MSKRPTCNGTRDPKHTPDEIVESMFAGEGYDSELDEYEVIKRKQPRARDMSHMQKIKEQAPKVLAYVVYTLTFAAIGVSVLLLDRTFFEFRNLDASENWSTTQGVVIVSQRTIHYTEYEGHISSSSCLVINYKYSVNGNDYVGDKYHFTGHCRFRGIQEIVDSNPRGKAVEVHYDPEEPQTSVLLIVGGNPYALRFLVTTCAIFLVIGIGGVILSYRIMSYRKSHVRTAYRTNYFGEG